jgi:hypothetical protein
MQYVNEFTILSQVSDYEETLRDVQAQMAITGADCEKLELEVKDETTV